MTLQDRLAANDGTNVITAAVPSLMEPLPGDTGVYTFTLELFGEHRIITAQLVGPESRLSDHLNGSAGAVEVWPVSRLELSTNEEVELAQSFAHVSKERLLFVHPVSEPARPATASNPAWKPTVAHRCWAGIGPYRMEGTLHTEVGRDASIALRLLDKEFLPLTNVSVVFPDGSKHGYKTVIVNRRYLDMLALRVP